MRGPYGLEVNDSCSTCKLRGNGFFCQMAPAALKDFDALKFTSTYPQGAVLLMEKEAPRGVYMLCEGEVKLSISSSEGKTLILRIARPGEVLGLMSALSNTPYEVTAEALRPCQVAFVRREDFLRFLKQHPEAYQAVIQQMGSQYQTACEQIRTLGLSTSVTEKLAKLLLDWSAGAAQTKAGSRTKLPLTHEEIAEFIGTTRESVSRTLSEFKNRQLVILQGSTLTIPNRAALESCVHG
jgi:CRP/FNR family transcriptional regulator, cyclic AMP receptor protein